MMLLAQCFVKVTGLTCRRIEIEVKKKKKIRKIAFIVVLTCLVAMACCIQSLLANLQCRSMYVCAWQHFVGSECNILIIYCVQLGNFFIGKRMELANRQLRIGKDRCLGLLISVF